MVIGIDVVPGDGTTVHRGQRLSGLAPTQPGSSAARARSIITAARLRRLRPRHERRLATASTFVDGLGLPPSSAKATPAVLRLYDAVEAMATRLETATSVLDEGDWRWSTHHRVVEEARWRPTTSPELVEQWMSHRNNVAQLESLISGVWSSTRWDPGRGRSCRSGHEGRGVRHRRCRAPSAPAARLRRRRAASAHVAGKPTAKRAYCAARDAAPGPSSRNGRPQPPPRRRHQPARFMREALRPRVASIKTALDPNAS
jgi:hypothetical protein